MPVKITLRDYGTDLALRALSGRLKSMQPVFADIGEALLTSTRQRFESESGPDGAPWAPLSKRYAKQKAKRGRSNKILQLNGYLFGQLAYQASDDRLEVGSNRVYAAIQQFGGLSFAGQRAGHVRLKTDRKGKVIKDARGLARFAKRSAKLSALRTYATRYHEIKIPARPFLGISASDREEIGSVVGRYLAGG